MLDTLERSPTMRRLLSMIPEELVLQEQEVTARQSDATVSDGPHWKLIRGILKRLLRCGFQADEVKEMGLKLCNLASGINYMSIENDAFEIFLKENHPELLNDPEMEDSVTDVKTTVVSFLLDSFPSERREIVEAIAEPTNEVEPADSDTVERIRPNADRQTPVQESSSDSDRSSGEEAFNPEPEPLLQKENIATEVPAKISRDLVSHVRMTLREASRKAEELWHKEVMNAVVCKQHDTEYIDHMKATITKLKSIPLEGVVATQHLPRRFVSVVRGCIKRYFRFELDLERQTILLKSRLVEMKKRVEENAAKLRTLTHADIFRAQLAIEKLAQRERNLDEDQAQLTTEAVKLKEDAFLEGMKLEAVEAEKKRILAKNEKNSQQLEELSLKTSRTLRDVEKKTKLIKFRKNVDKGESNLLIPEFEEYYQKRQPYVDRVVQLKTYAKKEFVANLRLGKFDEEYFRKKYWVVGMNNKLSRI